MIDSSRGHEDVNWPITPVTIQHLVSATPCCWTSHGTLTIRIKLSSLNYLSAKPVLAGSESELLMQRKWQIGRICKEYGAICFVE